MAERRRKLLQSTRWVVSDHLGRNLGEGITMNPLQSLIASGTKLWLDSIDPDLIARNRALGATGATSNPIIIADLIKTGRFDKALERFMKEDRQGDDEVAWRLTDMLVRQAQEVFQPVWEKTRGDDGYVSFEL